MNAIEALRKTTSQTIMVCKWDCCKGPGHNMGCIDFFNHSLSFMKTVRVLTHVDRILTGSCAAQYLRICITPGFGGFFLTELHVILMLHSVLEAAGSSELCEFLMFPALKKRFPKDEVYQSIFVTP